jgi:hypothetical protein
MVYIQNKKKLSKLFVILKDISESILHKLRQESVSKDVERAFGTLKAWFEMVRRPFCS